MKKLQELVRIVSRIKTQKIELIGTNNTKYGKLVTQLYEGIASGKYQSDKEAAIDIYGSDYTPNNYAHLKKALNKKLLNTLFFIDVSTVHLTTFQKAHIAAERDRSAIRILLARGAKKLSIGLAEKLLKRSIKFELTEISLELARILLRHYRSLDINPTKEAYYDKIVTETLNIFLAEIAVDRWYGLSIKTLANAKITNASKVKIIANYVQEIHKIFPQQASFKIGRFAYTILVIEKEIQNNHHGIIDVCQSAIAYFEGKKAITSKELIAGFYLDLLAVYIPLKRFTEGKKNFQKAFKYLIEGSINWYIALDYYFLLSMHTANYDKAVTLLHQAIHHPSFKTLFPEFKELWKVYQAYLTYLQIVKLVDKKGVNVAIIIIQILFLVAQSKEVKIIDKVESLRMYVHTHLRNNDSLRSNIFIKMLLKMVQSNFHKNGTIRRTKTLLDKLKATPLASKRQSKYVEIIPYETLWEISLGFLNNRAF